MNAQEIIANFEAQSAEMERQLDSLAHALIGCNTVIRTSAGLYLRHELIDDGLNVRWIPTSIARATRWEPASAQRIADSLPKSELWNPEPTYLITALQREILDLNKLIDAIKAAN